MTVTWHWNVDGEEYLATHAKRVGEERTLCGAQAKGRPVMRPPFFEMRCDLCEALRDGDEEMFPNHMEGLYRAMLADMWRGDSG